MNPPSNQFQAEEKKTISITEARELRLKVLEPYKGRIELINEADNGRVCTLRISDFQSKEDARVYAELLRLAPELLDVYMSDAKKLTEVAERFEERMADLRKKRK